MWAKRFRESVDSSYERTIALPGNVIDMLWQRRILALLLAVYCSMFAQGGVKITALFIGRQRYFSDLAS